MTRKSLEWRVPYDENFRYNAHKFIAIGYQKALPKIKSSVKRDETHTTGFIAEAMSGWLDREEPDGFDGYGVLDDPPEKSYDGARAGRGRRRSDLVVTYNNSPRNRFVCEAKRLKSGKGAEYIGDDGMGCFINGDYARPYLEVAMLGYVETKSVAEWKGILWQHIDEKSTDLELTPPQQEVSIISELADEWQSKHQRKAVGVPVKIFHILLDCTRPNE